MKTRTRRIPSATSVRQQIELDDIRRRLLALEYLDAENDRMRRALQARRAQLLEREDGYALS